MPVADFVGDFGWGYDGVDLFAPTRLYGRPDDFRAFVDRAHAVGLGVILDVVYNHLGSDGNYLGQFASDYFSTHRRTDWGPAINFDGPRLRAGSGILHRERRVLDRGVPPRRPTPRRHSGDLRRLARARPDGRCPTRPPEGGPSEGLPGRRERAAGRPAGPARGRGRLRSRCPVERRLSPQRHGGHVGTGRGVLQRLRGNAPGADLGREARLPLPGPAITRGRRKPRGTPAGDLGPTSFVNFIQNHDQIANSLAGKRCHQLTSPGRYRAMTALLLLGPATPMLFQGQEFAASSPFLFFADLPPELAKLVRAGRAELLAQFPSIAGPEAQAALADPAHRLTFERSKLDLTERERHGAAYALHVDLLRLRKEDPVFRGTGRRRRGWRRSRYRSAGPPLLRRGGRSRGSAALPQPRARSGPRRRRRAPARAAGRCAAGAFSGPARLSVTMVPARPISTPARAGDSRATAAVVFGPAR